MVATDILVDYLEQEQCNAMHSMNLALAELMDKKDIQGGGGNRQGSTAHSGSERLKDFGSCIFRPAFTEGSRREENGSHTSASHLLIPHNTNVCIR